MRWSVSFFEFSITCISEENKDRERKGGRREREGGGKEGGREMEERERVGEEGGRERGREARILSPY